MSPQRETGFGGGEVVLRAAFLLEVALLSAVGLTQAASWGSGGTALALVLLLGPIAGVAILAAGGLLEPRTGISPLAYSLRLLGALSAWFAVLVLADLLPGEAMSLAIAAQPIAAVLVLLAFGPWTSRSELRMRPRAPIPTVLVVPSGDRRIVASVSARKPPWLSLRSVIDFADGEAGARQLTRAAGTVTPGLVLLGFSPERLGMDDLTALAASGSQVWALADPERFHGVRGLRVLGGLPWQPLSLLGFSRSQLAHKRALDLFLVLAALPLALAITIIAALLVRLESRGPALYRQRRIGRDGKPFVLYKLRTMTAAAEAHGPSLPQPGDPRLTGFGAHLKRLHLDELPQLWNVLRGDMTIVGPRPEQAAFVGQLGRDVPGYRLRHLVPGGLTGLAQIIGDFASTPDDKLRCDLLYATNWSLGFDLKVIARTALAGLRGSQERFEPVRVAAGKPVVAEAPRSADGAADGRPWVLFLSGVGWTSPRQRQHELALQLARKYRVLFIEPPSLSGSRSIDPQRLDAGPWLLKPWGPFPLARVVPLLNRATRLMIGRGLARWLAGQDAPAVAWIDEDLATRCAHRCGAVTTVYDVTDEDWTFTRPWNRWHVRREMRRARRLADVIVCSSNTLAERLPRGGSRAVVVTNAADIRHFTPDGPVAAELDGLPRPILGFAGTASKRALDLDLVECVADARPDWSLVFVGGYEPAVQRRLAGAPNVTFLGSVPYERLPSVVRGFDVCLIPYRVGGLVDYVFPKKLFEYLAAGGSVVATPLPELRPFAPPVRLGDSPGAFAAAVEAALDERSDGQREHTIASARALAEGHSWDERGGVVRELVAGLANRS